MLTRGIVVIDFETTGLTAGMDRVIEVGAAVVCDGKVVETFVQLMNPGFRVPSFITELTGISAAMLVGKPAPEQIMPELKRFVDGRVCVAHNAAFDSRFYHAEMHRARLPHPQEFLCTMLLARRLVHDAPNHKLGELTRHLRLERLDNLRAHRALDDVLMTVALWHHLEAMIAEHAAGRKPDFPVYAALMKKSKAAAKKYLATLAAPPAPPTTTTSEMPARRGRPRTKSART